MSASVSQPLDKPKHDIQFPPFPPVPAGVTLVPFKDWEERGICMEPGPNDAEVDTLGIPTVLVSTKGHSDDVCKTNTKRKRMEQETKARKKQGFSSTRSWWEVWEDRESGRASKSVNPHAGEYERLHSAAQDFTSGRQWPITFASETGPRFIWTKLQAYLGIPEGAQLVKGGSGGKKDEMSDDEDEDELEEEDNSDGPTEISSRQEANIMTESDLRSRIATSKAAAKNEQRIERFFQDPEASIRIFMSAYAREQGYIWAAPNLQVIPRVVGFFIKFLLRNSVLPEVDRQLRRCVPLVELGLSELPWTATISRSIPDKFSRASHSYWGKKAEPAFQPPVLVDDEPEAQEEPAPPQADSETSDDNAAADSGWGASGWGVGTTGGWGNSETTDSTWGVVSDAPLEQDQPDLSSWSDPPQDFFQFLGPTTLPLTHKTGIVEQSMRKVKSIVPPNNNTPKAAVQADDAYEPSADAVEADMDRVFTKVVLSPMTDWDAGLYPEYAKPKILGTSQGPVVGDLVETDTPNQEKVPVKAYDPLADDITLVIESPEAATLIKEGMGIGGTWVQLVREGLPAPKKKSKSKKTFNGYWYLEEVAMVVPTFWLARKEN